MKKFGPKPKEALIKDKVCCACRQPFKEGDYSTLIELGPGLDKEARERCKQGLPYNAVAFEIHWDCAGGKDEDN